MRSYLEPVVVDQHPRAEGGVVRQHLCEWGRRARGQGALQRNAGYTAAALRVAMQVTTQDAMQAASFAGCWSAGRTAGATRQVTLRLQ